MAEEYKLCSARDVMKVSKALREGFDERKSPYGIGTIVGHEDGEVSYITEDGQTKIIVDYPAAKNFVVASRENTDESRQTRNDLVKLLRKNTKVSIRKVRE